MQSMDKYPYLIKGGRHADSRGQLCYNNDFELTEVKRIYTIENWDINTIRGWQGHKIEKRWFASVHGSFRMELRKIDDWEKPSKTCELFSYVLSDKELDVLYVPMGYASKIQSLNPSAKLLVMADYLLGEVEDDYRFALDYFET